MIAAGSLIFAMMLSYNFFWIGLGDTVMYKRKSLPAGERLDATDLIREATAKSLLQCGAMCSKAAHCPCFVFEGSTCSLYKQKRIVADVSAPASSFHEVPFVLMLRHDFGDGEFFPEYNGSFALNEDDETAKLFSRMHEVEKYRANDGIFHFKLCYPELNLSDNCYTFEQSTDPRSDFRAEVADFRIVSAPQGQPEAWASQGFDGLRSNVVDADTAWFDGNWGLYHWFTLGARSKLGTTSGFPAIRLSPTLTSATIVELYIVDFKP